MLAHSLLLRWRGIGDGSGGSLAPAPAVNSGFFEWTKFAFQKPGAGWRFRIDDEPLTDVPGEPDWWLWSPLFFAGEVTGELVAPTGRSTLFLLDVAPDPKKLGRDIFQNMVRELLRAAPSLLIGSEPALTSMGDLGTEQNPWLEFARLRRHAPGFLAALRDVSHKPRRALFVRRNSESLHRVRRVDRHTAISLARSAAVAALFSREESPSFLGECRLDVPFISETLDSAANRAMLALLLFVSRRTRTLEATLEAIVKRESDTETRTPLRTRWPVRKEFLTELATHLTRRLRQPPWTAVSRPEITAAGLNAISADPVYARAWACGWRALRHGFEGEESTDRLWVSPSWEVYERWCFVRLGQLLSAVAPEWNWERCTKPDKWVGRREGQSAELRLQPTFRSRTPSTEGFWSVSKERVPDVVLTVQDNGTFRFAIIDAKYRASRANVLDAMASAHIYQDSLRIGSQRPAASVLLIPAGGGAPWLEEDGFQAEHRVGCHPFSPDGPSIPSIIKELIA